MGEVSLNVLLPYLLSVHGLAFRTTAAHSCTRDIGTRLRRTLT